MLLASLCLAFVVPLQETGRRPVPTPPVEPPEATYTVEVSFKAQFGSPGDPRPAPAITVELGVGEQVGYTVAHWDSPVLGRVTSDAQGLISTTLEIPARYKDLPDARIWARVETPGQMRTIRVQFARTQQWGMLTRLSVRPGGTLRGSVLDTAGEPVARARMQLFLAQGESFEPQLESMTDAAGEFVIHYTQAGTFDLRARRTGRGSGGVRSLALRLDEHAPPTEVTLKGGASLHGRVLDPAHEPVPGLTVTAVPFEGLPNARRRFELEASGGLVLDQTRTDREGRFEFANLVPGAYAVHGNYPLHGQSFPVAQQELGPVLGTPLAPSGEFLVLVHHAQRLEVTVVDHTGAAVDPTAALDPSSPEGPGGSGLRVWPVSRTEGHWPRPIQVGDLVVFPAESDQTYGISWQEPTLPLFDVRARMDWNQYRVPVRIQLEPPCEPARLTVRILEPDGEDYYGNPYLWCSGAESGVVVVDTMTYISCTQQSTLHGPRWTESLSPGRYRIDGLPPPSARKRLTADWAEVTLQGGEERTIEVRLGTAP